LSPRTLPPVLEPIAPPSSDPSTSPILNQNRKLICWFYAAIYQPFIFRLKHTSDLRARASSIWVTFAKWAVFGIPRHRIPWACLHSYLNWKIFNKNFYQLPILWLLFQFLTLLLQSVAEMPWVPCM
jgi:hypothetical protein